MNPVTVEDEKSAVDRDAEESLEQSVRALFDYIEKRDLHLPVEEPRDLLSEFPHLPERFLPRTVTGAVLSWQYDTAYHRLDELQNSLSCTRIQILYATLRWCLLAKTRKPPERGLFFYK